MNFPPSVFPSFFLPTPNVEQSNNSYTYYYNSKVGLRAKVLEHSWTGDF